MHFIFIIVRIQRIVKWQKQFFCTSDFRRFCVIIGHKIMKIGVYLVRSNKVH